MLIVWQQKTMIAQKYQQSIFNILKIELKTLKCNSVIEKFPIKS